MEWIRRAVDYRTLAGKRDQLGFPLCPLEAARLEELARFFRTALSPELEAYAQRDQERVPISLVVSFSGAAKSFRGRARDLSGEGLFIETGEPLPAGSRTVVSVRDEQSGDEFRLGAEVVRLDPERGGMGLRLLGIPLRIRLGHRRAPAAPRPLRRAA